MMKVCLETFGCRLNRAEALAQEAGLEACGWKTTQSHSEADLIIIRGCSVTARAESDSRKLYDHVRRKYPTKRVILTGCMKEKAGEQILRDLDLTQIPKSTSRAYLKVQDGCSQRCAFCIVPQFRGRSVSVPFDEVLDRAKRFIDAGFHEIVLSGCNLAEYSSPGEGATEPRKLPDLVAAIAALDRNCRVRLGSVEPGKAARGLIDVMEEHSNVCRFLHLPIQSGSPVILSSMRRPYSIKDAEDIAREALSRIPHLSIGCDLMAGFPGESALDFASTKGLFKRLNISRAHIFPYSERPGTVASSLPGAVPVEVRRERAHELARIADAERANFAKTFVGRLVQLVVEDEEHVAGWTSEYLWCRARHEYTRRFREERRSLVTLRVVRAEGHMLIGEAP